MCSSREQKHRERAKRAALRRARTLQRSEEGRLDAVSVGQAGQDVEIQLGETSLVGLVATVVTAHQAHDVRKPEEENKLRNAVNATDVENITVRLSSMCARFLDQKIEYERLERTYRAKVNSGGGVHSSVPTRYAARGT